MTEGVVSNLAGWVPEPTVMKPALEWIIAQDRPVLLAEIAEALGVRPTQLTATLARLEKRGLVRRQRMARTMPHNRFRDRTITRLCWLYSAGPVPA